VNFLCVVRRYGPSARVTRFVGREGRRQWCRIFDRKSLARSLGGALKNCSGAASSAMRKGAERQW
jgi:hypothetical protein